MESPIQMLTDSDGDGLTDDLEINTYSTNPNNTDSDGDGLNDYDEVITYGTNPNNTDSDGDGLTDELEINTYSTNPNNTDSDGDGLTDELEINTYSTNPNNTDSDGDGLTDGAEVNTYSTNPNNTDSDGDGLTDGAEVIEGSDPSDPNSPAANTTNRFELLRSNDLLFTTLVDGDTVDLNEQGTREFNIRYYPDNNNTVSIEFKINDQTVMIDNQEPYMIGEAEGYSFQKRFIFYKRY